MARRLEARSQGPPEAQARAGAELANLFFNPNLPDMDDYYEPWTYDYENLTSAKPSEHQPVAQPISQVSGDPIGLKWGPNWEDDLAGGPENVARDPNVVAMEEEVKANYEQVFMMYLPRICEHCLNPSCVASCPSGAMYKREEDGIVLVDQERCRGWRMCVSGFRTEVTSMAWARPRSARLLFSASRWFADRLSIPASAPWLPRIVLYARQGRGGRPVPDERDLLTAQLKVFWTRGPRRARGRASRRIHDDWIEGGPPLAGYALAMRYGIALPLHPEVRTMPMVWYVPPLSPVMSTIEGTVDGSDDVFSGDRHAAHPIQYLRTALRRRRRGTAESSSAWPRCPPMRELTSWKGDRRGGEVGITPRESRTSSPAAIAKYEDRTSSARATQSWPEAAEQQGSCG